MQRSSVFLVLMLATTPALAQSPPAGGFLQVPPKNPAPESRTTPASNPPAPAPRAAVQQVAPNAGGSSALGHSAPGRPPPVVQPQPNTHAQKPPAAPPKPAAKPGTTPAPAATAANAPASAAKPAEPPLAALDKSPAPTIGAVTQQPLPRWASFRSDEVNLRAGPGTRYPIDWVYRRAGLPVQIEREYDTWRLVTDYDGVKGWVHAATLQGRRGFAVKGKDRTLRKAAADDAAAVAILRPGVVGRLRACDAAASWCEVQTGDYKGFLKRDDLWGIFAGEAVK